MERIPDHIQHGLKVLFIGYNPSLRSGECGHHYANPTNRFWRILYESGLTSRLYQAEEDALLLSEGYGFTNIVARPTRTAAEITKQEYAEGRLILLEKLALYQPAVACFVGKGVYEQYIGSAVQGWGLKQDGLAHHVKGFVAPSSSGLVRMSLSDMVVIYRQLKAIIDN